MKLTSVQEIFTALTLGIITVDEARELLGLEPFDA